MNSKSDYICRCKIEKVHNVTHFCLKSTDIIPSIILCLSFIATITVYLIFSLLFHSILSIPPLSYLESSNMFCKSIQIIKFFKLILNLDPKLIKPTYKSI